MLQKVVVHICTTTTTASMTAGKTLGFQHLHADFQFSVVFIRSHLMSKTK